MDTPWKMRIDATKLWATVDQMVLNHFTDNPNQYFTGEQLKEILLDKELALHSWEIMMKLALSEGIKGKIKGSIHKWRIHGYPILSSDEIGKGYVYVDPNHPDTPKFWDKKLRANEKIREHIPIEERRIDEILFNRCLEKCKKSDIHAEMVKVATAHGFRKKKEA